MSEKPLVTLLIDTCTISMANSESIHEIAVLSWAPLSVPGDSIFGHTPGIPALGSTYEVEG